jgi:hypothetical protein
MRKDANRHYIFHHLHSCILPEYFVTCMAMKCLIVASFCICIIFKQLLVIHTVIHVVSNVLQVRYFVNGTVFRSDYNRYSVTRLFSNKPTKQSPRSYRVFLMVQLICDEALCQWMMSNSQHSERIIILQNVEKWRKPFS